MRWTADARGRLFALVALVMSFAVIGAGCQSGGAARTASQTATQADPDADPLWWTDELSALHKQYLESVALSCKSAGALGRDQCMKGKMLGSLSPNSGAAKYCPQDDILVMFVECVDRLTTAERAYVALGLDPVKDMNWTDPIQALEDASRLIADRLVSECKDCLAREITYMFAADPGRPTDVPPWISLLRYGVPLG